MMSPLNTWPPLASLMSMLCGCESLLSKWMVKAAPAGAVTVFCSNSMLRAEIWTAPPAVPPLAGACEPGTCDPGTAEAGADETAPDEPGAAEPPDAPGCVDGAAVGAAYVHPGADEEVQAPTRAAAAMAAGRSSERRIGTSGFGSSSRAGRGSIAGKTPNLPNARRTRRGRRPK